MSRSVPLSPLRIALVGATALALGVVGVVGPGVWDEWWEPWGCEAGGRVEGPELRRVGPLNPKIGGDWVVWTRWDRSTDQEDGDVFAMHIPSGEVVEVASGPAFQNVPEVYGDVVVWREELPGFEFRLRAMNLTNGTRWTVPVSIPGELAPRGMYGSKVLVDGYGEVGNESGVFHVFDLVTHEQRVLSNVSVGIAEIWLDKVVWVHTVRKGEEGRLWQLISYDLSSGEVRVLFEEREVALADPDLYEDWVVFMRATAEPPYRWEVWGLRVGEDEPFLLAEKSASVNGLENPRVAGPWVVFTTSIPSIWGSSRHVEAVHVETGEVVVVDPVTEELHPDVWGDRVAYTDIDLDKGTRRVVVACLGT